MHRGVVLANQGSALSDLRTVPKLDTHSPAEARRSNHGRSQHTQELWEHAPRWNELVESKHTHLCEIVEATLLFFLQRVYGSIHLGLVLGSQGGGLARVQELVARGVGDVLTSLRAPSTAGSQVNCAPNPRGHHAFFGFPCGVK